MKKKSNMKWGIETKSTPFGTEEPFVKPFGDHKKNNCNNHENNSHRKTSSPVAPALQKRAGSYSQISGGRNGKK